MQANEFSRHSPCVYSPLNPRAKPARNDFRSARLREVAANKLDNIPRDPSVLMTGASFTMDTDASPLDFLNDVPGAADFDDIRSRDQQAMAGGVTVWVVGYGDLLRVKEACSEPPRVSCFMT